MVIDTSILLKGSHKDTFDQSSSLRGETRPSPSSSHQPCGYAYDVRLKMILPPLLFIPVIHRGVPTHDSNKHVPKHNLGI